MAEATAGGRLSPDAFLKTVRKGQRFAVLVLEGAEEYLLRVALREYVQSVVSKDAQPFDLSEYRASEIDGAVLWNSLITMPLAGDRRVVVLELSGQPPDHVTKVLKEYVKKPCPTTSLVIVALREEQRQSSGISFPPPAVQVEFKEVRKASDRLAWAVAYVARSGKTIEPTAAEYLVETSSQSLADLAAKLDHAILYVGQENVITVRDLMRVAGVTSEYDHFKLEDAMLAGDAEKALTVARSLLEGGEHVLALAATGRRMILKLWQISHILGHPRSAKSESAEMLLRSILGGQYFKLNDFKAAACRLGEGRIRDAVRGILEIEVAAKSSGASTPRFYEWVWRLAAA